MLIFLEWLKLSEPLNYQIYMRKAVTLLFNLLEEITFTAKELLLSSVRSCKIPIR